MRRAMTASVLFYNSGNYGVPLRNWRFQLARRRKRAGLSR
jgi:hypothetical protein